MRFEILSERKFNIKFGNFKKCESLWEEIDESVVDLLLYSRFKDESKKVKLEMIEGKTIPCIVGYIRKQTQLSKCPLCATSYKEPFYSLSIVDNETKICPDCGTREQLERFLEVYER